MRTGTLVWMASLFVITLGLMFATGAKAEDCTAMMQEEMRGAKSGMGGLIANFTGVPLAYAISTMIG